ncbi:ParA family protein [uncultured Anaerovibrio sp.]|uniref:ParA family protein n=1 Tax=uncultured Anaerovibrio sp. TaxID=361586 RepID=UPI0026329599|nr:ParA family protein [uncultured Anaerovibrio sp.]
MGKVIAVANQKGGVGKTTTSVSLSAALAEKGKRVLLVDCDPQGNATSGFGINKQELELSVYDIIIDEWNISDIILPTDYKIDIAPSQIGLAGAEIELSSLEDREYRLQRGINTVREKYDFIIIDCPPSLGFLTLNSLAAADSVLIPLQCEFYALEGLSQLLKTIEMVRSRINVNLYIEGVVLTMYDSRTNLSQQVENEVRNYIGDKVYNTTIPRNVRLSEAPSYGCPIFSYDPASKGAQAYMELAQEVIDNG